MKAEDYIKEQKELENQLNQDENSKTSYIIIDDEKAEEFDDLEEIKDEL